MNQIALFAEQLQPIPLQSRDAVLFDSISVVNHISYDAGTGRVTTLEPGLYTVWWCVTVQSNLSAGGLSFSLVTDLGDEYRGNSSVKSGQISCTASFWEL
ncbi:MAG: hypothetical protein ACOYI3_04800 [Christensenellales bacterium]|jgi:hypothetical protein